MERRGQQSGGRRRVLLRSDWGQGEEFYTAKKSTIMSRSPSASLSM